MAIIYIASAEVEAMANFSSGCETHCIPGLDLTDTPKESCNEVTKALEGALARGSVTGMMIYTEDCKLMFQHSSGMIVGGKTV